MVSVSGWQNRCMAAKKLIDTEKPTNAGGALQLNLRHLQAFSAVAATGSVTQAADALFRVASAVTRAVAELEACLGVSLFERKARGMLMNVYGEAVRVRAQRVEQEFAAACLELAGSDAAAPTQAIEARSLLASMFSARRLALFASLSELHNMPAVAAAFGVTQPALSALVRELESRTGRTLFTRTARGVTPTRAGSLLAFRCKRALAELRSIGPDLAALRGAVEGRVAVGALPLSRTLILPSAIAALVARHPRLHVSTVESPYEALAAALQRAQWVLSRPGSPSRELLERAFREAGRSAPMPTVETGDLALLRGLLLQSDMVTAMSAHQLHYEIDTGALVVLNHPLESTRRRIGITQRKGALASPAARALIDAVRQVVAARL